jgi:type III pantothenate kinase
MILQLDIGNTRLKWRLVEDGRLVEAGVSFRGVDPLLPELKFPPQQVWVSSVAGDDFELELRQSVQARWNVQPWFARSSAQACGVSNSYVEPARMGVDRWLSMLSAWRRAQAACCVVDAGSALTIDLLSDKGRHIGGYILPGLDSMERALLQDTDRVRFSGERAVSLAPGVSTEEAVHHGLLLSQAGAVALALEQYGAGCPVYFCGGGAVALCDLLQCQGEVFPDLVLEGLALLASEEQGAVA